MPKKPDSKQEDLSVYRARGVDGHQLWIEMVASGRQGGAAIDYDAREPERFREMLAA